MKKLILVLALLVSLSVIMTACQPGSSSQATTSAAAQTTASAAETTAAATAAATTAAETTTQAAAETTTQAAAATTQAAATQADDPSALDFVELTFYLIGDPSSDYGAMMEAFNEKLKKDINATVDQQWISWGEREQKYPLLLASGEPIDAIFAGTWTWFYQEAAKGAYLDITDLAPVYMPKTYAEWDDLTMKQIALNGKIYGVPTTFFSWVPMGYIIRGDIADEIGFDRDIKGMDDYGEFMRLVSEKRPDMWTGDWTATSDDLLAYFARESGHCYFPAWPPITMDARGEGSIVSVFDVEGCLDFFKKMRAWSEAGYWSKSVLAETSSNNLIEGRAASRLHNFSTWENGYIAQPDWDLRYYWTVPYTLKTRAMQDGTAIPASAKNPERALMMLERLHQDKEYWMMMAYGLEGRNYEITPAGAVKALNTDIWAPNAYGDMAFRRIEWMPPVEGRPANRQEVWDSFFKKEESTVNGFFIVNFDKIANERAAVIAIVTEYAKPLTYGYVADVEAGFAELKAKLDEAGLQVMLDEIRRQHAGFRAANA